MEPSREELLSALKEAKELISVTLSNETLSVEAERKRKQLKERLESFTPPRHEAPQANQDDQGEELYDDIQLENRDHSVTTMQLEGVPDESEDHEQLEYEDMSEKEKNVEFEVEDFYDDTVPEESKNVASTNEGKITEDTYEIAETQTPNDTNENQEDDLYDGVEPPSDDKESLDTRERSATEELESLATPIKPEDVEEIVMKGYLEKHRKKGIYIGSKWQKRYCVVRTFAMYYYMGVNATAQKGTIILPGYKASTHNTNKSNGREFILTRDNDRPYIFRAESKESADKWVDAITKAANTSQISKRQSEIIDTLRNIPGVDEEDTSSLCYDDDKDSISNVPATIPPGDGEFYDDVNQSESDKGSASTEDIDYEIPSATDAQDSPELYEAPVEETQPEPPSLYPKPQPIPPAADDDFYEMPETENNTESLTTSSQPPPEPQRLEPPSEDIPHVSEEDEEIYDDIAVQSIPEPTPAVVNSKPPQPPRNRSLPIPNENKPSPPLTPRMGGRMPLPPTPQKAESSKPTIPPRRTPAPQEITETKAPVAEEPSNDLPSEVTTEGKGPPPPPPEDTVESKSPPPSPPEEEKQVIDYSSVYQALWDCKPDADDELEFKRGDLIYIYEKPHCDWWIGSRYKPQGYETRLIPKNYLTEAFNL